LKSIDPQIASNWLAATNCTVGSRFEIPYSRDLLEKLIVPELVKEISYLLFMLRFIARLTGLCPEPVESSPHRDHI
jgi:hypothetical protein